MRRSGVRAPSGPPFQNLRKLDAWSVLISSGGLGHTLPPLNLVRRSLTQKGFSINSIEVKKRQNIRTTNLLHTVIPAKAGIQSHQAFTKNTHWIPTFVGMTNRGVLKSHSRELLIFRNPQKGNAKHRSARVSLAQEKPPNP